MKGKLLHTQKNIIMEKDSERKRKKIARGIERKNARE